MKIPAGFKFKSLAALNEAVSSSYQEALKAAKRECGRGCYRSRGKSLRGVDINGDLVYGEADSVLWGGGLRELIDCIEAARQFGCAAMYVDGGIDYAASVSDFGYGVYDPMVVDWSVQVWRRPGLEDG